MVSETRITPDSESAGIIFLAAASSSDIAVAGSSRTLTNFAGPFPTSTISARVSTARHFLHRSPASDAALAFECARGERISIRFSLAFSVRAMKEEEYVKVLLRFFGFPLAAGFDTQSEHRSPNEAPSVSSRDSGRTLHFSADSSSAVASSFPMVCWYMHDFITVCLNDRGVRSMISYALSSSMRLINKYMRRMRSISSGESMERLATFCGRQAGEVFISALRLCTRSATMTYM